MTYTLMIALSAQRFMAIGFLFAVTGFIASNAAGDKLPQLPTVGLIIILVSITVAGRRIVLSLNEGSVRLMARCAEIEERLGIEYGFGQYYSEYKKKHPRGTGSYATNLSVRLLSWVVAIYGLIVLLSKAPSDTNEFGLWIVAVISSFGIVLGSLWDDIPVWFRRRT